MALVTGTNIGQAPIIIRTSGQILEPGNTATVDTDLQTVSDAVRQQQLQVPAGTPLAPDISSAQGSGGGSGGSVSVTNFPTTQQVAVTSSVGVGTEGDGTTTVNRIAGRDRQGVTRFMLTDERGRQKISHAQPDILNADLAVVNDALVISMDSLSDAMIFTRGAAHAGFNLAFEYSPDTTAVPGKTPAASPADGNWYPIAAKNAGNPTVAAATTTGTLTTNGMASFELSAPAASAVRARVTAATSGTLTVGGLGSTAARPTSVTTANGTTVVASGTVAVSSITGSVTPGSGAGNLGKAEDAAHASGDTGVAVWGVRAPTTPATQTSATGDYGSLAVDAEGKLITAGSSEPAVSFASVTTLTTTTAAACRAAQAAGIRTYVTDVTVSNTSATATRVDLLDGSTVVWTAWLAPGAVVTKQFGSPLRGTAATAFNANLSVATTDVRVALGGYSGV